MDAHLALIPEEGDKPCGVVKPVLVKGDKSHYGLSIGYYSVSPTDNRIHITLNADVTTIIHEVATSKAVRAEMRAAEKVAKGVEKKPTIILDPKTKRFKEVY